MTERSAEAAETPQSPSPKGGAQPRRGQSRSLPAKVGFIMRRVLLWLPLIALAVWTLTPLVYTFSVSLKTQAGFLAQPGLIPDHPTLDAYREVLGRATFRGALYNSLVVGIGTLLLTLALGVPTAYAFARFRFVGRHVLLLLVLLPLFIPKMGLMAPLYRMAAGLGILNTKFVLIVVFTGTILPLGIWLMVGFFQAVPRELEEAAAVDGASLFQAIRRVVLPLALPALITIGVLAFREAWNEFELAVALTHGGGNRTLPYELYSLRERSEGVRNQPGEAAFSLLTVVPLLLVYMRIERYVIRGITAGSVK